jgi:hypothetical protein
MDNEPSMVLLLTVPFKDISGKGIDEIIDYIQSEVAGMRDVILTGLMDNYFETERSGQLDLDPSDIN